MKKNAKYASPEAIFFSPVSRTASNKRAQLEIVVKER
jgi:hypothetical protein